MSLSSRSSSSGHSSAGRLGQSQLPVSGYYAYRHNASTDTEGGDFEPIDYIHSSSQLRKYDLEGGGSSNHNVGYVSTQPRGLNLHIPCAFSYSYGVPVPPQDEHSTKSSKVPSVKLGDVSKTKKQASKVSVKNQPTPLTRPFVNTVKSNQLYQTKMVSRPHENSRTQAKTSIIWDFHAGEKVAFQAVDYGQELYEQATKNLARQFQQQKLEDVKKKSDDNCFDFSKPGVHSSRYTTKALEKAVADIKNLPDEVERLLKKDKRFEPTIQSKATRVLNLPRNTHVYKDLIPVDPNPDVRTQAEKIIQAEMKKSIEAARQPARTRDPEPKLDNFQTNSYTRIRPAAVPTPSKPTLVINVEANHDFDTIERGKLLEEESNRLE